MDEVSSASTRTVQHGDKPDATPKPLASPAYSTVAYGQGQGPPSTPSTTSTRITMANIRDMMEKNAQDTTRNLEDKHAADLLVQQQAVTVMAMKIDEIERSRKTMPTTGEQASPFETPRAERPQDLAYKQILTSSKKKDKVKSTPEVHGRQASQDQTITELVKLMNTTLKNTNSKETTTDLPKFTGKDAHWERWYELLRSYFQAKGWLETFDHATGPGTPDNPTPDFDNSINEKIYQKIQSKC